MRLAVLLAAATVALTACATGTGPDAAARFDSFEGEAAVVAAYDAVYVAPVTASDDILARIDYRTKGPTDRTRPLGQRDVDDQAEALREAIVRRVGKAAVLRDAPGPGVLTIAAELTRLDANMPTLAELADEPALDMIRTVSIGDAAVRVTLSEDGRALAVIDDDALLRQINDPGVSTQRWFTASRFFDRFADKMAALLS